jgi:hypothetical protein
LFAAANSISGQDLPIGIQQIELHRDELADIVFGLILDQ